MALQGLTRVTIGVPDPDATGAYYTEFGLVSHGGGQFATADGGVQLRLVHSPRRRLVELGVATDDLDDLDRIAGRLSGIGYESRREATSLQAVEPCSGATVAIELVPPVIQQAFSGAPVNLPGRAERLNSRAAALERKGPVRPRRLGHVVIGTPNVEAGQRFFMEGIGFKLSDSVPEALTFMRCSSDHHNLLLAKAPVPFLHHTSWQVDDLDEIGRGAMAMLEADPSRHVWGFGRHYIGSNFFWYLRDPAGNFTEYYSDLDCIVDDALWKPEVFDAIKGLYSWGPPPPPSFLEPEDLAELMMGAHQPA